MSKNVINPVYFYNFGKRKSVVIDRAIKRLYENLNFTINKGDIVGIKVHMGEHGNETFLKPQNVKTFVNIIKDCGGKPVIFDTTTLYNKKRNNALDYYDVAIEHGYSYATVGAPIIIADGLKGDKGRGVKIENGSIQEVEIAMDLFDMDSLIVLSHFKGHNLTGFGGAIKNMGMGCVTKKGKIAQHIILSPDIDEEKCSGCGTCIKTCGFGAPYLIDGIARIDREKCVGCSDCFFSCPENALLYKKEMRGEVQDRLASAASAVKSLFTGEKICFFNFMLDITASCDCVNAYMMPILSDLGIMASMDPVAIDRASLDEVYKAGGRNIFYNLHGLYGERQLETAERLGMGNMEYELVEI